MTMFVVVCSIFVRDLSLDVALAEEIDSRVVLVLHARSR